MHYATALALLLLLGPCLCKGAAVVQHSLNGGKSFQQIGLLHLEDDMRVGTHLAG